MTLFQILFVSFLFGVCAYAMLKGDTPERIVAVTFIAGGLASRAFESGSNPFHSVEAGILLVDAAMFATLLGLALLTTRYWGIAMASFQGTQVLGHLAHLLDDGTLPKAYFVLAVFWSIPMLALLGIGTWRHEHRLRRLGVDYSWTSQLPAQYRHNPLGQSDG